MSELSSLVCASNPVGGVDHLKAAAHEPSSAQRWQFSLELVSLLLSGLGSSELPTASAASKPFATSSTMPDVLCASLPVLPAQS